MTELKYFVFVDAGMVSSFKEGQIRKAHIQFQ